MTADTFATTSPEGQPAPAAAPITGTRVDWAPVPKVDLLPEEIVAGRRFRRVQQLLAVGVLGTAALCGGGFYWAHGQVADAQSELDAVEATTRQLQAEKTEYADVPRLMAQIEAARGAEQQAMATDVRWYQYLGDIARVTPSDVALESLNVKIAAADAATPGAATGTASDAGVLGVPGIGTVTVAGNAKSYPKVATWMEQLDSLPGLEGTVLSSAAQEGTSGFVKFGTTITLTSAALNAPSEQETK